MVYLNDFVNEQKFLQAMHLCYSRMRSNPYFDQIKDDAKQTLSKLFFHQLFPMLSGFVNTLTEPLTVNHYPTLLTDSNWILQKHHYYKLTVKKFDDYEEYDGEVVVGIFQTDFGHSLVVMNQIGEYDLNIEFFHFDLDWLLRKFHSIVFKLNVKGELFAKEGRNHMTSIDEPSWCHDANLNKINPPYTVVGTAPIFTEILTKVESNDSNNS